MNTKQIIRTIKLVAVAAAFAVSVSPAAAAAPGWTPPAPHDTGAVTGAGGGPTLGVGGPSSYSGDSTSNRLCQWECGATVGVGGPSSYTGGSTVNDPGGTATLGVGNVNSYTGYGTAGTAENGTNPTDRTGNYGPGSP